jgi:hypothetical protein
VIKEMDVILSGKVLGGKGHFKFAHALLKRSTLA